MYEDPDNLKNLLRENGIGRIVLIDDNLEKIVQGAQDLYDSRPNLHPLQERLTLFAFGHYGGETAGTIRPGVIHVVDMPDWSGVQTAVELLRQEAA